MDPFSIQESGSSILLRYNDWPGGDKFNSTSCMAGIYLSTFKLISGGYESHKDKLGKSCYVVQLRGRSWLFEQQQYRKGEASNQLDYTYTYFYVLASYIVRYTHLAGLLIHHYYYRFFLAMACSYMKQHKNLSRPDDDIDQDITLDPNNAQDEDVSWVITGCYYGLQYYYYMHCLLAVGTSLQ